MASFMLTVIVPMVLSVAFTFAGWGWPIKHRNFQLAFRTLAIWSLMIIPILIFRQSIRFDLIGYIILAFIFVGLLFLWEKLPITFINRKTHDNNKIQLEQTKTIYDSAQKMIEVGSINNYLDLYIDKIYWKGLKDTSFPYIVAECRVPSRFIYDLAFADIHRVPFSIAVLESDNKQWEIAKEAKLVEFESIQIFTGK